MVDKEIANLIKEGRAVLGSRRFPGEIIEPIKDRRLRKWISDQIFKHEKPYDTLKDSERKRRKELLRVQYVFIDYLTALDRYRAIGIVLFLLGFVTFLTSSIGLNDNLFFGVGSMVQGVALICVSAFYPLKIHLLTAVIILLPLFYLFEVFVFGIPEEYVQLINDNFEFGTHRMLSIALLINAVTPIFYIGVRVSVCLFFAFIGYRRKKYLTKKQQFEETF